MIPDVIKTIELIKLGLEVALGVALIALGYQLGCMREKRKDPSKKVFTVYWRGTLEEIRKMKELEQFTPAPKEASAK